MSDEERADTVRDSGVFLTVPTEVRFRWPAYEALPPNLRIVADLLAEGFSDAAIAQRLERTDAETSDDIATVYYRLCVRSRVEIVRLRRASPQPLARRIA